MDTKLKSSTKQEAVLLVAWIFWGILFTEATNFFASMENLDGDWYGYAKAGVVIGGALALVISIPLAVYTVRYVTAVWGTERGRKLGLDRIPIEIPFCAVLILGLYWFETELFYGNLFVPWWLQEDGGHIVYYMFCSVMRRIFRQLVLLTALGLSAWILVRQLIYQCWEERSLIVRVARVYRRYHFGSSLGRKLTRKRWMFWICVLVLFAAVGMAAVFIDNWEYDMAVLCGGVALAAVLILIFYQLFFWRVSRDIILLVEQIGAVSRAEPLNEVYQISPKSIFYEPFHQLEELEAAVEKSARKQLQAERLKIDLITNVSHDLKTPLTSMVGYVDLLKQEDLSQEARDYIDVISQKQELLKEMIQNLFELSKSTSGVEELHMETLDMRKLIEQILGDMEDAVQDSGMTIRTAFDAPPLLFSGDNEKMYRVVQNLLGNALKYSLEHTRIYVDVKRADQRLLLQIKNISNYEMDFDADEITGRFVRGDRSRTTEGNGLGLAIARSFTQNMGGTLDVEVDGDLFKVTVGFPAVESVVDGIGADRK